MEFNIFFSKALLCNSTTTDCLETGFHLNNRRKKTENKTCYMLPRNKLSPFPK